MLTFWIVLSFAVLELSGFHFPRAAGSVELQKTVELLACFISILLISAMAFEYESTATLLKIERDREHQKTIALAQTDTLTGLANRRNFETLLSQRIAAYGVTIPPRQFVLCYVDLDGFKPINDEYGHNVGDEVLQAVSARLQQVVRGSDIVGRHGGDEFMLFLDSVADKGDVEAMAKRTLQSLCEPIHTNAGMVYIGASIGFSMFPENASTAEQLIKSADSAMYEAKRGGGNRWCFYQAQQQFQPDPHQMAQSLQPSPLQGAVRQAELALRQPGIFMHEAAVANAAKITDGFVSRLMEFYIHPSLRNDKDNLPRVRIFILTLLMMFTLLSSNCVLMLMVPAAYVSNESKTLCVMIVLPLVTIMYALLERLRRNGDYLMSCKAFVLMEFAGILAGISISGGAALSPATQFFAFPPLTAYFFGGARWGWTSVLIAMAAYIILWALDLSGIEFVQTLDSGTFGPMKVIEGTIYIAAISGMAFIYESITASLKHERDVEYENVNRLAQSDALTGLANRLNFDAELAGRIARYSVKIPRSCFTLCYLDLDGFKPINDRFGHDVGDEVLQAVSERLRNCLRDLDYVGRHGGDEFMLIFDAVNEKSQVEIIAKRLMEEVSQPIQTKVGLLKLSGSFGFAVFPDHASEPAPLRSAADKAMYTAKQDRTGWCFYQPEQRESSATTAGHRNEFLLQGHAPVVQY